MSRDGLFIYTYEYMERNFMKHVITVNDLQ